jgi:hypothetical protein
MSTVLAALKAAVAKASASGDTTPVMDLVVRTGGSTVTAVEVRAVKPEVFIRRGGVVSIPRYAESVEAMLCRLMAQAREEELNAAMQVVAEHILSKGYSRSAIKAAGKKAVWFVSNEKGLAASAARLPRFEADLTGVRQWEAAFGPLTAADFLATLQGPPALLRAFESELAWKGPQPVHASVAKAADKAKAKAGTARARTEARIARAKARAWRRSVAQGKAQVAEVKGLKAQVAQVKATVKAKAEAKAAGVVIFRKEEIDTTVKAQAQAQAAAHKAAVAAKAATDARAYAQSEVARMEGRLEALLGDEQFVADLTRISAGFGAIASLQDAVVLVRSIVSAVERGESRARAEAEAARGRALAALRGADADQLARGRELAEAKSRAEAEALRARREREAAVQAAHLANKAKRQGGKKK